jgi:hypothetical protein
MNVFCLGGRVIGGGLALQLVRTFLTARSAEPSGICAGWRKSGQSRGRAFGASGRALLCRVVLKGHKSPPVAVRR